MSQNGIAFYKCKLKFSDTQEWQSDLANSHVARIYKHSYQNVLIHSYKSNIYILFHCYYSILRQMSHLQAILTKNHQLCLTPSTFSDASRSHSCLITQNSLQTNPGTTTWCQCNFPASEGDMSHYNLKDIKQPQNMTRLYNYAQLLATQIMQATEMNIRRF